LAPVFCATAGTSRHAAASRAYRFLNILYPYMVGYTSGRILLV
jgi:hypothetical protein